ncbi:MAG: orotate phosphoribosyltransferase [Gemmatimonadales bacterium]
MTRLEELLLARSVRRGDFVLASGKRSSYYIDCRLTTMSAEGLTLVGSAGLAAIRAAGWDATVVGGLTLGADPVAYAIAAASFGAGPVIDAFTVRKEPKAHGTRRLIEGNFHPGARAVVIEDVITTGESALKAIDAIEREGGRVLGVLALVDREQGGERRIRQRGYGVVAITTASRLGLEG